MFSKVSRKPVQLSEEEISKILRKAGSQSLQNNLATKSSRTSNAEAKPPVMTAKFSASSPPPAPASKRVNDMVNLPGTDEENTKLTRPTSTRTADTSPKRSHENSRDRTLSKSLSPVRSPKLSGLKNMIGANQMEAENSMPHLSLDVPKNISRPVARRRVRLTSDDIQLEKQAISGVDEYIVRQPHYHRPRGSSSPERRRAARSLEGEKGPAPTTKSNSHAEKEDTVNDKNVFKSSQLIRQNSYTKLTLLERKQGKSPWVLKQLSSESESNLSISRSSSANGTSSPGSPNGSTGGSTNAEYNAAVKAMSMEIRILQRLAKVPYICHLREDYINRHGNRCLVLEYAEGGSMLEWLRMVRNTVHLHLP